MIHEITSSLETFKTLTFTQGLNVVLADKSQGATDKQTRNSSGKTSIVSIIHFVLGARCEKDSIFRSDPLVDESFSLSLGLSGQKVQATRSGSNANSITVDSNLSEWPEQPTLDSESGETRFSRKNWNAALGASVFGVTDQEKYSPSFRAMFPYFVRREWDGGFHCAEKISENQQLCNVQVNLSYLLGLDWSNARKLQEIRDKEKTLKLLKKDSDSGVLGSLVGRTGELRTKLTVADTELTKLQRQLDEFQVLPEYRELEQEASAIAIKLSEAANENTLDRERIKAIESQLESEQPVHRDNLVAMYKEAEVVLPELVTKQLDDVERFHQRVIRNRIEHLKGGIAAAEERILSRERNLTEIDQRRREIMNTLSSRGALDQMTRLEEERSRQASLVEDLSRRLKLTEEIESTTTQLTIERAKVRQAFTLDHREHDSVIREAILIFEEFSKAISDHEGSLTIDVTDNGPTFSIQVEGGRSVGIRNMQIFCFDMMLSILWSRQNRGPGFLVHDSHLFDGMDSRQIAKAIEIGARQSAKNGFQYIITMNSDMVPHDEFSAGFEFDQFVNSVRLNDETDTGGLFGVRL